MCPRVARGRFDSARYEEALGQLEVNAAVRQLPGFQGLQLSFDRSAGRLVAVSTWDTEEHARFSRDAFGGLAARGQARGIQPEPPEIYEVVTPAQVRAGHDRRGVVMPKFPAREPVSTPPVITTAALQLSDTIARLSGGADSGKMSGEADERTPTFVAPGRASDPAVPWLP
jgi:heme-degrading monooxygenase HmoA